MSYTWAQISPRIHAAQSAGLWTAHSSRLCHHINELFVPTCTSYDLPVDVGYAAAYVLSDAAEFLAGRAIFLDGGLTAKMALPYQPAAGERTTSNPPGG